MNDEKKILVTDKASGKQRFTEPVPQQTPREQSSLASGTLNADTGPESAGILPQSIPPAAKEDGEVGVAIKDESVAKTKNKTKQEITSLEQFIEYAYGRKGLALSFKTKILQDISRNTSIPVDGLLALRKQEIADKQFVVPRQILLAMREIDGYPAIKDALREFVQSIMLRHPIFKDKRVVAAIRNLPDAPRPSVALKLVMEHIVQKEDVDETGPDATDEAKIATKPAVQNELRINAANCLAVWFSITRQLSLEEITEALNDAVWAPIGRSSALESAKLRALTAIEKAEGIGIACELYKRRALASATDAARAIAEVGELRSSLAATQGQLEATNAGLSTAMQELNNLREQSAAQIAALQEAGLMQATHLRDDLSQLRSRLLRRLITDVEMLGVGLTAIQTPQPRIHVISDRIERVIDALQAEIIKLREV